MGLLPILAACSSAQPRPEKVPTSSLALPSFGDPLNAPFCFSTDAGLSWQPLADGLPTDLQLSFIDTVAGRLLIATDHAGLYISDAGKQNWSAFGEDFSDQKINALHIEKQTVYMSPYRRGIYRSSDLGDTWQALTYDLPDQRVQAQLRLPNCLLAATDSGIYQLQDGRENWKALFFGEQVISLNREGARLVAGTTAGILLSEDAGATWRWVHQDGALHNTALIDGRIYGMYISGDLYVSADWGENWALAQYGPQQASYVYDLVAVGDHLLMGNNYGVHRSMNGGLNWTLDYSLDSLFFFDFFVLDGVVYGGMRK